MWQADCIRVEASMALRVKILHDEYQHFVRGSRFDVEAARLPGFNLRASAHQFLAGEWLPRAMATHLCVNCLNSTTIPLTRAQR
jgi:hypothetical protein